MRARAVVAAALLVPSLVGLATLAPAGADGPDLDDVRIATARFHSVAQADQAGYDPFLPCMDSDDGGMGQHLVDFGLVDADVDALAPEALVYEVRGDKLKLVGVEYIVPVPADPDAAAALREDPPELFGEDFHENTGLGVFVLHAWVWRANPAGTFEDWNPDVVACP